MTAENIAVFGVFDQLANLELALSELRIAGFRKEDFSVLVPEHLGNQDLEAPPAPAGAMAGTGSGMGGTLGWLLGTGTFAIPRAAAFLAAGPLVAVLAGFGASGAVGGLTGALVGIGLPEYEAKRYARRVTKGAVLLSVHCGDAEWKERAAEVLKHSGAGEITTTGDATPDYAKMADLNRIDQGKQPAVEAVHLGRDAYRRATEEV